MSRKTRKLIWSAPLVAVFAIAGALALFMTLQPGGVLAQDAQLGPPREPGRRWPDGQTMIDAVMAHAGQRNRNRLPYRPSEADADGSVWEAVNTSVRHHDIGRYR